MLERNTGKFIAHCETLSKFKILSDFRLSVYSVIKIPPKTLDEPVFEIHVIVDPVSRGAQKVAPIVNVLRQVLNAELKIYLNCQERISDMPLKR